MIPCFLLEPTGRSMRCLRRFVWAGVHDCPGGYHQAIVPVDAVDGEQPSTMDAGDFGGDPRWPSTCEHCGYQFNDGDQWQVFVQAEYRRADTGATMTLLTAPPGAMWWADWLAGDFEGLDHFTRRRGQPHLIVKTPGGDWDVDGESSRGAGTGWRRTGEPPQVVAQPSIQMPGYHGWLGGSDGSRPGFLVEC